MNSKYDNLVEKLRDYSNVSLYAREFAAKELLKQAADAIESLSVELEKKENGGWIIGRTPTKEECSEYGGRVFLTTVHANSLKTIPMSFSYDVVRGKEVGRWKWYGRLSPWEVIAWKSLPDPYNDGDECEEDNDEVHN